jgi:aminopeptidase-like protein
MTVDTERARGERMYQLASELWEYPRSLTGDGLRATLHHLSTRLPDLQIHEVATGTRVGDWTIPKEWNLTRARLWNPSGELVCDTQRNNLHVLGYSIPFRGEVELSELQSHLYSLPEVPTAIPYVTSYYEPRWGLCLSHEVRSKLANGRYRVDIDTRLEVGSLTYADLLLPGERRDEILISTYVCHPSMANNELSGPVVTTELANYLRSLPNRRYTYRIVFAPETIGALTYLHLNFELLKQRVRAAFNVTCVGDDRTYSFLPTRDGNHQIDTVSRHVLRHLYPDYREYPWSQRGSDERQYSAPSVGIPMVSLMRSKYWEYPEYHTSLDDLEQVVSAQGLQGGFEAIRRAIDILEQDTIPLTRTIGEPMLSRRDLYSSVGAGRVSSSPQALLDVWSYCDGKLSALEIADILKIRFEDVKRLLKTLEENDLVTSQPRLLKSSDI